MPQQESSSQDATHHIFNGCEVPQFRNVDDFILDSARFEIPPVNDLARWNNRIVSNMLYYQTNYFVIFIATFLIFTLFNGKDLALGMFAITLVVAVAIFSTSANPTFHQTRRDHPLITLGAIVISFYIFISLLASVLAVCIAILLPLVFIFTHASCRLRNFKSKVNQHTEKLGLKTTVMGRMFQVMGITVKTN